MPPGTQPSFERQIGHSEKKAMRISIQAGCTTPCKTILSYISTKRVGETQQHFGPRNGCLKGEYSLPTLVVIPITTLAFLANKPSC